ncbi:unnamed protein product [Linum tenue]|uniref:WRKY domain-containing protein n=1 Tax=Linum tenue TaxID=586396 RepID=A0AAV0M4E2_9ROSI|nr:unnamed protein product [Linum tenue]CAI0460803.1 unnamed protein product [Linum tenue]
MEGGGWSWEQRTLVNELIQGMEFAKQLSFHLEGSSSVENAEILVQRILSSYEKALLILNWSGSVGHQPLQAAAVTAPVAAAATGSGSGVPGSPLSTNGSPRSEDFDGTKDHQAPINASKKRKTMPRWTDQVKVSSENGLEGPIDDGYSWRKYGQKDILGAKYPRSYYRCTYRNTQNCWAIKQVQRSDEDPTIFEVTYRGQHSCSFGQQQTVATPPAASPEKKEQIKHNFSSSNQQQPPPGEALLNLQKGLKVDTRDLDKREAVPFAFPSTYECQNSNFSQSFLSPATPEPNYYHVSPFVNSSGWAQTLQHSDSDLAEILSAQTSATSSPMLDLDFQLEPFELVPSFSYAPGYFS